MKDLKRELVELNRIANTGKGCYSVFALVDALNKTDYKYNALEIFEKYCILKGKLEALQELVSKVTF